MPHASRTMCHRAYNYPAPRMPYPASRSLARHIEPYQRRSPAPGFLPGCARSRSATRSAVFARSSPSFASRTAARRSTRRGAGPAPSTGRRGRFRSRAGGPKHQAALRRRPRIARGVVWRGPQRQRHRFAAGLAPSRAAQPGTTSVSSDRTRLLDVLAPRCASRARRPGESGGPVFDLFFTISPSRLPCTLTADRQRIRWLTSTGSPRDRESGDKIYVSLRIDPLDETLNSSILARCLAARTA